ncbi:hypothetical protein QBC40DRAFT_196021 [Triangularia verruculosa]|uniref:Uncharacterized protein n=1 Tax=Triangularia verruculosa TaxID=2587418 RepID=A0AAN6XNU6_9PEZI|nr:hypothetical protein QBC40DRAFT_196021 [Triangularia verruculosa]
MTQQQLTPEEEAASARAAHQAALRKAKREAKIKAGAESRLNKITGLGGGVQRDLPTTTAAAAAAPSVISAATTTSSVPSAHADPEEVDISASEHFYRPATTNRIPPPPVDNVDVNEQALRQMMLGFDGPGATPGVGIGGGKEEEEDPMMAMMMQMLGGAGGSAPGGGGVPPNPFAGLAGMGGFPGRPGQQAQEQQQQPEGPPSKTPGLFKVLHTLIALSLGVYLLLSTPFTGSKLDRDKSQLAESGAAMFQSPEENQAKQNFVWGFATAEILLFTTRFILESRQGGGGEQTGGVMGGLLGFLPQPLKGRVEMGIRYAKVVGRVRGDVLLVVFVLGVGSWLRG